MENPLEYDLLPLPWEITHRIVLMCRRGVTVQQLFILRLLNKTWKAAVEAGVFGPHGRLMCSVKSTRFLLLVGAPSGVNRLIRVSPAIGLLDERCRNVYICPVASRNDPSFDETVLKQGPAGGIHINPLNKSIQVLEEGSKSPEINRRIKVHSFQSGEWKTESFKDGDLDPNLGCFEIRFCFAGEDRIFCLGDDGTAGYSGDERVLAYEPRTREWLLLPPVPKDGRFNVPLTSFCYASEGSIHLYKPGGGDRYFQTGSKWFNEYPFLGDNKWVVEQNPGCYSHALDGSQAGWKAEDCKQEVLDLLAKQLTSSLRIDPSTVQRCTQNGLTALLRRPGQTSEKCVARERPAQTLPGEKTHHEMTFRKFQLQGTATGVIPVTQLKGTSCLVLGRSSAVLLKDGEAQRAVNLRWRGELESGGFEVVWASACFAEGTKSFGRTGKETVAAAGKSRERVARAAAGTGAVAAP